MKNNILKIVLIFVCAFVLSLSSFFITTENEVYAEEQTTTTLINDEETESKLNNLYDYINTMKSDVELMNELDPVSYIQSYIENGEGNLSVSTVISAVVSLFFKEVKTVLSLAFSIVVIGIICSLFKNLQSSFSSEGISQIAFFACYAILIILLSKTFIISLSLAKDVIVQIATFMDKVLPLLAALLIASGGLTQAATMDPIILGATILIPKIYLNIIIPLILITFVLQFANNISTEPKLSNLCGLIKKSTVWIQGFIITVFIGVLTIRGISSSTIDAVTLKTTKFTIDNFIPIVGKSLSDAISSVAGYSLIIKNAIGSIGLIVIILIIIYPIIKIVLSSLIFKLSAALLEPITDKRITSSIAAAGESLILIMSCVLCVSLMFFVLIAIMISAGKFVVGG
ncbi:stage III sporulation protein AE [Clostridium saudiense]|uniref:stage III sporulation protein AE n=1 Tax=Clostridium saudiense TaxID=1414720 RepID=UPI0012B9C551|nr:stage III sporulation protein AE [Clostridium saudiense]MDU3521887.1 stage III sporulation protein AE [Clostridium saudiense]